MKIGKIRSLQQIHNAAHGIEQRIQTVVVIQGGDDVGHVLAHVHLDKPGGLAHFVGQIGQVGAHHPRQLAAAVGLFKGLGAVGKEAESGGNEDAARVALLQIVQQTQHAVAAGNDVVGHDDVLALHRIAHVFVGNDAVTAVHHLGIVPALVEHAHVQAQNGGIEDIPVDGALVGRDDHHVLLVKMQIAHPAAQGLQHLIGGHEGFKARQRNCVLHPGIVSVKGDDVLHAQAGQFLQHQCAIHGFTGGTTVLPALVQEGHDNGNPLRLSADGSDDALQVRIMVVRRHGNGSSVHVIGNLTGGNVGNDVDVVAANALGQQSFALAGAKPGAFRLQKESIQVVAGESVELVALFTDALAPVSEVFVDSFTKGFAARHCNHAKGTNGTSFKGHPACSGQNIAH